MGNNSNLQKYKSDINDLIKRGESLLGLLKGDNDDLVFFREDYEQWYSESSSIIEIILPRRLKDFELYYHNPKGDSIRKAITYTKPTQEGFNNSFDLEIPAKQVDYAKSLFANQLAILKSCEKRFESSLFDIKQFLQAELFDNELESAKELNKNGFVRCAGAIAGVVLEGHLLQVCLNHEVKVAKKNPVISDLSQLLKNNEIIEIHIWRNIQRLSDIRNKCDHKKENEPTKDDVDDLIDGVDKIIKTVF